MKRLKIQWLAILLVMVLPIGAVPASAAPADGSIAGVVRIANGSTPLAGAIVHVIDRESRAVYSSQPTGSDGSFRVADLPHAMYDVGVESAEGLFLVERPVVVTSPVVQTLQLVVSDSAAAQKTVLAGRRAGSAGVWANPLTATLIVVGSAAVVGVAVKAADDETSVSSF